jgi:hypothetical protein
MDPGSLAAGVTVEWAMVAVRRSEDANRRYFPFSAATTRGETNWLTLPPSL